MSVHNNYITKAIFRFIALHQGNLKGNQCSSDKFLSNHKFTGVCHADIYTGILIISIVTVHLWQLKYYFEFTLKQNKNASHSFFGFRTHTTKNINFTSRVLMDSKEAVKWLFNI